MGTLFLSFLFSFLSCSSSFSRLCYHIYCILKTVQAYSNGLGIAGCLDVNGINIGRAYNPAPAMTSWSLIWSWQALSSLFYPTELPHLGDDWRGEYVKIPRLNGCTFKKKLRYFLIFSCIFLNFLRCDFEFKTSSNIKNLKQKMVASCFMQKTLNFFKSPYDPFPLFHMSIFFPVWTRFQFSIWSFRV